MVIIAGDGIAGILTKPIKPSQLFDTLVSVLTGKSVDLHRTESKDEPLFDAGMGARMPLRILLAEDNVTNQKLAQRMLEQLGYRADIAANGLEAVEAVQRQSIRRGVHGRSNARDGWIGSDALHPSRLAESAETSNHRYDR